MNDTVAERGEPPVANLSLAQGKMTGSTPPGTVGAFVPKSGASSFSPLAPVALAERCAPIPST